MVMPGGTDTMMLDACCLLNLYATRHASDILGVLPWRFAIADRVATEALYVYRGSTGEDAFDHEAVDLQPLVMDGTLSVLSLNESVEAATFVSLAAHLDDGEAMTAAIAIHRGYAIATDDRKAIRTISGRFPNVRLHTTASLIKHRAESASLGTAALKLALLNVRERGRFAPGNRDPLHGWWTGITDTP